jgi:hypothetical protein
VGKTPYQAAVLGLVYGIIIGALASFCTFWITGVWYLIQNCLFFAVFGAAMWVSIHRAWKKSN